jgi:hypothetical protein
MPDLKNVEIFGSGTWNGFKFVDEDLAQIVKNTNALMAKGELKPPVKLGHSEKQILDGQDDGNPALGRATGFRLAGDKIVCDLTGMPDLLFASIEKERFTTVSVEMDHVKHFGWFITAVALLGADLPAVKTIADLQAFLTDSTMSGSGATLQFSEPKINHSGVDMTEMNQAAADTARENAELKQKFSDAERKLQEMTQRETERAFAEQKAAILGPYKDDAKAGKIMPAIVDELERSIDAQRQSFTGTIQISADLARRIATGYTEALQTGDSASDGDTQANDSTPDVRVSHEIAKIRAAAPNIDYLAAEKMAMDANPVLFREYHQWTVDIAEGRV